MRKKKGEWLIRTNDGITGDVYYADTSVKSGFTVSPRKAMRFSTVGAATVFRDKLRNMRGGVDWQNKGNVVNVKDKTAIVLNEIRAADATNTPEYRALEAVVDELNDELKEAKDELKEAEAALLTERYKGVRIHSAALDSDRKYNSLLEAIANKIFRS
jgi:hypothetical protein